MIDWRYVMYSKIGGMSDLLNMCYWDFWGVVNSMVLQSKRNSGEVITRTELKPSQKQMIEERKKLVAKEILLEGNK